MKLKPGRKPNKEKYNLILSLRRGDACSVNNVFYEKTDFRSINLIGEILGCKKQNIWGFIKRYGDIDAKA